VEESVSIAEVPLAHPYNTKEEEKSPLNMKTQRKAARRNLPHVVV
jgi:hypothetical protein